MRIILPVLLAACAVDVSPSAVDQAALPQTFTLTAPFAASPGDPVDFLVSNAPPNASVRLILSDGQIGPGACPASLGGECADITRGSGYRTVGTIMTDGAGTGMVTATVPAGQNAGAFVIQAVHVASAQGSAPVVFGVTCSSPTAGMTEVIDCNGTSNCQIAAIQCTDGMDCEVQCGGVSACQIATVTCPVGGSCTVICDNTSACQGMEIMGGDGDVTVECPGLSSCQGAEVTCGSGNCITTCDRSNSASLDTVDASAACLFLDDDCL